ncbi:putative beta-ketoacyl synthase [gamma proteobacterium HdN1]|nr:putative beta-ketoacyl synthase [gamma proteobacterium HdN1]
MPPFSVAPLPVIVGYGGINAAGRSSFHHAFKRIVYDALAQTEQYTVLRSLSQLMGRTTAFSESRHSESETASILQNTLIRTIQPSYFDASKVYSQTFADLLPGNQPPTWVLEKTQLPTPIPAHWRVTELNQQQVLVAAHGPTRVLFPNTHDGRVNAAGQLPSGFEPGKKYSSRGHPKGLQLAVYAASDALHSIGIPWEELQARVAPDQISVYASSAMGQLDHESAGAMLQAALRGERCSSKNLPFGLAEMPADFINAYVLGNLGNTGGTLGACATLLYNLEKAVSDIRSGRAQIAIAGAAEAPITPEIIEGYRVMSALAEDCDLLELDGIHEGAPDHRRACRPFAPNCGFTLGESAQYFVLMSSELALATGARIHAAVPDVFINADGYKKSIASPGIGNYLTLGRATALAAKILGDHDLRHRTLLHAHGTGTPQNRTSESHIFDRIATAFAIPRWRIAATKCYVGHSLGPAAGDQISFALGSLATGIAPGITSVEQFADDVHQDRIELANTHRQEAPNFWRAALINSKGFGGNNATALLLSAEATLQLLKQKHGGATIHSYQARTEAILERQQRYENALLQGQDRTLYQFGSRTVDPSQLVIQRDHILIPGQPLPVLLDPDNPYGTLAQPNLPHP